MSRCIAIGFVVFVGLVGCDDDPPCLERPGYACTLAGTGEFGFNRDGLPARETDLFLVSAAKRGPDGSIYIMDFNNQRLRKMDDAGALQTIAGNGFHAFADVSVPALDSPLENPIDFDFLGDGRIVFVSAHDPRVLELGLDGRLRTLAGAADGVTGVVGNEGDGGPAEQAHFMRLEGIAVGRGDAIYVADGGAHRVRVIRAGVIDTFAGTGEPAYSGDGGPAVAAALNLPSALALAGAGELYIADTVNHAIRRVDVEGTITTVAGAGTAGFAGDDGPASAARLDQPYGVAVAPDGSLYIGDRSNFRIRRVAPDGVIETLAGTGVEGSRGDRLASETELGLVARVAFDGDAVLVADQTNSRVIRIDLQE